MPKLRLTREGFTRAITTLSRECDALASQASIEARSGDADMAQTFASRAEAIASVRDALITARPSHRRTIAEVEIADAALAQHAKDAASFSPEGWGYLT